MSAAASSAQKRKSTASASGDLSRSKRIASAVTSLMRGVVGDGGAHDGNSPLALCDGSIMDDETGWDTPGGGVLSTPILALQRPGELCAAGLEKVKTKLVTIHGQQAVDSERRRLMVFYHEIFFKASLKGVTLSEEQDREMHTVAQALDSLVEGDLARVGDILMGRYKSLEKHARTGTWEIAAELEALPQIEHSLTSEEEMHRIAAIQLRKSRLQQSLRSVREQQGLATNVG